METENLTGYDCSVLQRWQQGWSLAADNTTRRHHGSEGIPPDLLERMTWCRSQDMGHFREILWILGRRGSKNYLGAILGAWVLYRLLAKVDPQRHYGISPTKRITVFVFAGHLQQAVDQQYRDLVTLIKDAPCFAAFMAGERSDTLALFTPAQVAAGITDTGAALISVRAAQTTPLAGRGPSVPMAMFDEFAHLLGAGSTATSAQLYSATVPAMTEFGPDALTLQTSSPWDRLGQLWESRTRALAVDTNTGEPLEPGYLVVQLPSWALYEDWEQAHDIEMWPSGPTYPPVTRPIIAYDETLAREESANPDTFAVEYRAQFRANQYAYFPKAFVDRVFAPHQGTTLTQQTQGRLNVVYAAHGDPSLSQANFGFAIGHLEPDTEGRPHVIFDVLHAWKPADFAGGTIDYQHIENEIFSFITHFAIHDLTFDQWNSAGVIQHLQARADHADLPWRTRVSEQRATHTHNWEAYETFKTAIGHHLIHAPHHSHARSEMEAVMVNNNRLEHPTSGPVTTKDLLDAMVAVTWTLIGQGAQDLFQRLARNPITPAPGITPGHDQDVFDQFSGFHRQRNWHGEVRGPHHNPSRGPTGTRPHGPAPNPDRAPRYDPTNRRWY